MTERAEVKQLRDFMEAFELKLTLEKDNWDYDRWPAEERSDHEMQIMMLRAISILLTEKLEKLNEG